MCQRLDLEAPEPLQSRRDAHSSVLQPSDGEYDNEDNGVCELSPPTSPSAVKAPIDSYLTSLQDTSPNGTSPHKTRRDTLGSGDLISKGKVTLESADLLVQYYLNHLDRFLYSIAGRYKGLEDVRKASPTLLAAMCTVSAFQRSESRELFDICNREYRQLVSTALFEKRNVEFIRALCIGSFWLPNASRILSGDAIRRSADCRLHRNFHRLAGQMARLSAPDSEQATTDAVDRVRLWYLLFVCDQQLAILHNRDCVMHPEKENIEGRDLLLSQAKPSNEDVRLVSQVSLLVIMGQIKSVLGSDEMTPVPKPLAVQLNHFSRELDQWYSRFSPLFGKTAIMMYSSYQTR